jgi:hypothetical protein
LPEGLIGENVWFPWGFEAIGLINAGLGGGFLFGSNLFAVLKLRLKIHLLLLSPEHVNVIVRSSVCPAISKISVILSPGFKLFGAMPASQVAHNPVMATDKLQSFLLYKLLTVSIPISPLKFFTLKITALPLQGTWNPLNVLSPMVVELMVIPAGVSSLFLSATGLKSNFKSNDGLQLFSIIAE